MQYIVWYHKVPLEGTCLKDLIYDIVLIPHKKTGTICHILDTNKFTELFRRFSQLVTEISLFKKYK